MAYDCKQRWGLLDFAFSGCHDVSMIDEHKIMKQTIGLAHANVADGGLPYAAIIARGDEVIATGVNGTHKSHDPSDHAEMVAIRAACAKLGTADLSDCVIYVVGQPCAMCLGCMIMAGLENVVYAVNVETKDMILTKLPQTSALYEVLGSDFGTDAINYRHMPEYSVLGEAVFREWNEAQTTAQ